MTEQQTPSRNPAQPRTGADWRGRATRIEIDLDALAANVGALKRWIGACRLLVVVKADGYGHGACEAGKAAVASGADRLGVYTVGEGVVLREAGITVPILVIGPFRELEAEDIVTHGLTPNITSRQAAELLLKAAGGRRLKYHVKFDTGLMRSGIPVVDAIPFMEQLSRYPSLELEGVFTHFASADECDKTPTWKQLKLFLGACENLRTAGFTFDLRHAANSAATLDLPETHLDMVRCGITAYGCYPSRSVSRGVPLRPALRLLSSVSRVRAVSEGTGVGYGHEFRCKRNSTIALIPIGYGDGLPRALGLGGGRVIIRGQYAPIVGRMSMDQITVDVTHIPGVRDEDRVTLIGENGDVRQSADDLAEQAGTINYDILTGLLPRVPRLYLREDRLVGQTATG